MNIFLIIFILSSITAFILGLRWALGRVSGKNKA